MSTMSRKNLFKRLSGAAFVLSAIVPSADAFSIPSSVTSFGAAAPVTSNSSPSRVAYKSILLPMDHFGITVPIACWFPTDADPSSSRSTSLRYQHRISVRRIGQLLAGWDFIPPFASRNFLLEPGLPLVDGQERDLPSKVPVILLAHGYLGSRFDLSHLAEKLAAEGFLCLAAEYPESLAASFERVEGLDRSSINAHLLQALSNDWNVKPTRFGVIGHSLGCGTVLETGDESWARVCIAGFPRLRDGRPIPGNVLLLTSMNDGAVSPARFGGKQGIPSDISILEETLLEGMIASKLPTRAAVVFDRPDAPNHISFLSEGVNDAMIELLSPLLPVAQALSIPVLDFDRYQVSRDSLATADIVHPLILAYMKQQMLE